MTTRMDALYWMPLDQAPRGFEKALRFQPKYDDEGLGPIEAYTIRDGMVGLPRAWAFERFGAPDEYATARGEEVIYPKSPAPWDDLQKTFWNEVRIALGKQSDVFVAADTGCGKTVLMLWLAAIMRRRILVIVPKQRIAKQWREECQRFLGVDAHIFDGKSRARKTGGWRDADVCIASMATLRNGNFPKELYDRFPLCGIDEAHNVGARATSEILKTIASARRIALSATPERSDGMEEVFFGHLGPVAVVSEQEPMPIHVHVVDHDDEKKLGWEREPLLQYCVWNRDRNDRIAGLAKQMYDDGRNTLVMCERIDHIYNLIGACKAQGIPRADIGVSCGEYVEWDENGKRKRVKPTQAQRDEAEANARVLFATYGSFREAVNIPRLDAGIDASPAARARQVIGRIRRPWPGHHKRTPVWVTIRDLNSPFAMKIFEKRLVDYEACSYRITGLAA